MRADVYLVERGVAASRTLARRLIEAGAVLLDGRPVESPRRKYRPARIRWRLARVGRRATSGAADSSWRRRWMRSLSR